MTAVIRLLKEEATPKTADLPKMMVVADLPMALKVSTVLPMMVAERSPVKAARVTPMLRSFTPYSRFSTHYQVVP